MLDMAAGSCNPPGMYKSVHPLLCGTRLNAQSQELQHLSPGGHT